MHPTKVEDIRALVVDDDRHMRILIRDMLMALGAQDVADASSGARAFEEIEAFRPNLILCDLKMEPMGGLQFLKRLRADADNPCRLTPVIMVTAYAEVDVVAKARDAGVTEFMAKPVSAAAMAKRVERVLKDHRPFVTTPDFTGPDRRRGRDVTFGGKDRRENEPTYLEIPEEPKGPPAA